MTQLGFIFTLLLACAVAAEFNFPAQYDHTFQAHPNFVLSWTIKQSDLIMKVESDKNAWAGISIGQGLDGMSGGDMIIATVQNNKVIVQDYHASCKCTPDLDTKKGGKNSIKSYRGSITNSKITYEFVRPLQAEDKYDTSITKATVPMAWAQGPSRNGFAEHTSAGQFSLNFYTGKGSVGAYGIMTVHAVVMPISFGLLMTSGILMAVYLKKYQKWFKWHIGLQVAGTILALAGAALGFVGTSSHFTEIHHYFGIIVLALLVAQPFMGWIADKMWNPNRTKVPIFPDKLHWWIGQLIIVLSTVAVVTGILLLGAGAIFVYIYVAWIALVTTAYVVGYSIRYYGDKYHDTSKFAAHMRKMFNPHACHSDDKMEELKEPAGTQNKV